MSVINNLGDPTLLLGRKIAELLPRDLEPVKSTIVPAKPGGYLGYQLDEFDVDHDGTVDVKRSRSSFHEQLLFRDADQTFMGVWAIRPLMPNPSLPVTSEPALVVQVTVEGADRRVLTDYNSDGKVDADTRRPLGAAQPLALDWK